MKTIHKYLLTPDASISLPEHASILTIQVQGGEAMLWALVDPKAEKFSRHFRTVPTGAPLEDDFDINHLYISSFQLDGMTFHVFEHTP